MAKLAKVRRVAAALFYKAADSYSSPHISFSILIADSERKT